MSDAKRTPEDIEKELSVGKFAGQQVRTVALTVGGAAVGWMLGKYGLAKTGLTKKVGGWLAKVEKHTPIEQLEHQASSFIIPGVTAFGGYIVGQIASLYEHWTKVERERLSVEEVNKDVASLMSKRVQFEDTLAKQDVLVDGLLEKQKSFAAAFTPPTEKLSQADRVESKREKTAAAEASRA